MFKKEKQLKAFWNHFKVFTFDEDSQERFLLAGII